MGARGKRMRAERGDGGRLRPRVVIAGGGVAAIEALIALRDLRNGFLSIDWVAPNEFFTYRPLSVAEPFGLATPRRFPLREIASHHAARLHVGTLDAVNANAGEVALAGRQTLGYDVLLIAIGARPRPWLTGATHFSGPDDVARLRTLLAELDQGSVQSVVFTSPPGLSWTLPLYELALLTATHIAEHDRGDVMLSIVTPEANPLEAFGPAAARHVRELAANRGIELRTATRALRLGNGRLELDPGGALPADHVVALPELRGVPIDGLPSDGAGFIPVDRHGAVRGLPGVYAAGDGVAYPVKQGGLATQQADAAAEAIAARLGAPIEPRPFQAKLRGQLLTGLGPAYLVAGRTEAGPPESSVAVNPLWWPPSKIAGRYLAPYLSHHTAIGGDAGRLRERPAVALQDTAKTRATREELRELALAFAQNDAVAGDYASALRWLDTIEELDGVLAPPLAEQQLEWREQCAERPGYPLPA